MFRQDRTNPSSAVSNWKGRKDTAKAWPSTAVSSWLNGGVFGGSGDAYNAYFVGGTNIADGYANTTGDKLGLISETISAIAVGLTQGVAWTSGMNNNGVAGYTGCGYHSGGSYSGSWKTASKLVYASDTNSTLSDLPEAGYGVGSFTNSGVAGYVLGGSTSGTRRIGQKIVYLNDTSSSVAPSPSIFSTEGGVDSAYVGDGASNSGTAGYYAGGIRSTQSAAVDKFIFSTEARMTALSNEMTCDSYYTRATEDQGTSCWFFPGNLCNTVVNKMPISNETSAAVSSGLSVGRNYMGVIGSKGVAVYAASVAYDADITTNTMDKWVTASDTRSTVTGVDRRNGPSTFANADWS